MLQVDTEPRCAEPGTEPAANRATNLALERLLVHRRTVFLVCYGLTRNVADAEDLAQETFLRACREPKRVPADGEARAWLCAVARNACRDHARRLRFRMAMWPLLRAASPDTPDLQRDLEQHQEQDVLRRALARLTRRHREVLVLREYGELSYAEIARVLQVETGTVMSRLSRARRQLADMVRRMGVTR